jgi:hypothetical protein
VAKVIPREALLEMACEYETWEERLQDPTATPVSLPLEFLKTITHDFSSEQELGSGGSGVVYKVRMTSSFHLTNQIFFSN